MARLATYPSTPKLKPGDRVVVAYLEHAPEISQREGTILRLHQPQSGPLEAQVLFDWLPVEDRNTDHHPGPQPHGGLSYWVRVGALRRQVGRRGGAPPQEVLRWGAWRETRPGRWVRRENAEHGRGAVVEDMVRSWDWEVLEANTHHTIIHGRERTLSEARGAVDRWIAKNLRRRIV